MLMATLFAEFGADYFVMSKEQWATATNPVGAANAAVDSGIFRKVALAAAANGGSYVNGRVFVASTFNDPTSYVQLVLQFNDGSAPQVSGKIYVGYGELVIRGMKIPSSASGVIINVNAHFGAAETSSFYFDNLIVQQDKLASP